MERVQDAETKPQVVAGPAQQAQADTHGTAAHGQSAELTGAAHHAEAPSEGQAHEVGAHTDAHADASGEHATEGAPKKAKKKAFLDLSGVVTVAGIKTVLDALANEPGEAGELSFELKANGKFGNGAVNGMIEGWAELMLSYSVNDQNFNVMAIDTEGAIGAGIDIAGFVQAKYEVGYGRDWMNKWWAGSAGAAKWVLEQLRGLNDLADGQLINFGEPEADHGGDAAHGDDAHGADPDAPTFERHDHTVFHGGEVRGELGGVKGSYGKRSSTLNADYHDDQHNVIHSKEEHKETNAELEVAFGTPPKKAKISYHRDWSDTTASPMYYANGIFDESELTLGLQSKDLFKKGSHTHEIPTKRLQDAVVNTFAGAEALMGGFGWAKHVNGKLFDSVVKQIYGETGREVKANLGINLIFNWNMFGESDGSLNLMYFRVKVEVVRSAEAEIDAKAAGVELGAAASKSEVVYEHIGADTVSYIQRQYIYQTPDRPWAAFKASNLPQIYTLVENISTPGSLYHDPAVEAAFRTEENHEAALSVLLTNWTTADNQLKQIVPDASLIGEALSSANSWLTWSASTKRGHMAEIVEVLNTYAQKPEMLSFFFSQLPAYNVQLAAIEKLAQETNYGGIWNRLRKIALDAGKEGGT
jgi:hypothetical protein